MDRNKLDAKDLTGLHPGQYYETFTDAYILRNPMNIFNVCLLKKMEDKVRPSKYRPRRILKNTGFLTNATATI